MDSSAQRTAEIEAFRAAAGWSKARMVWLGQDASSRRYARMHHGSVSVLLMDAPRIEPQPCTPDMTAAERETAGWNAMTRLAGSRVEAFVLIAEHLRSLGLSAPKVFAHDSQNGLAIIEDFGEGREFARLIEQGKADEKVLYSKAAETLAFIHTQNTPDQLAFGDETWPILPFDDLALRTNADLFVDWLPKYDRRMRLTAKTKEDWISAREELIARANSFPRTFTLRDYHAENLLWLPNGKVGLLDFQDAVFGWDAWDMAMLTQDARRDVSPAAESAAIRAYLDGTGRAETAFRERLAVIGTLNALRIVGVFARLVARDGKPRYRQFMQRQQDLLARNLSHPAAAKMANFVRDVAPFILEQDT